jgi:hypothetical protein
MPISTRLAKSGAKKPTSPNFSKRQSQPASEVPDLVDTDEDTSWEALYFLAAGAFSRS